MRRVAIQARRPLDGLRRWSVLTATLATAHLGLLVVGVFSTALLSPLLILALLPFAPLGYLAARWGLRPTELPEGPCQGSGRVAGRHWCTFPKDPETYWMGLDAAQAVRTRRPTTPPSDGHGVEFLQRPVFTRLSRRAALAHGVSFGAALGLFGSVVLLLAAAARESITGLLAALLTTWGLSFGAALLVLAVTYLPFMVAVTALESLAATRIARRVRLHGTVLRVDERTLYLTEGTETQLRHDAFGAVLTVTTGQDALTVRGEHRVLHWLHEHLRHRPASVEPDPEAQRLQRAVQQREA